MRISDWSSDVCSSDLAFVHDTLMMPDAGTSRADFPGGDARQLYHSIRDLLALPDETTLFVGHDYCPDGRKVACAATVAEHRRDNKHVHDGVDERSEEHTSELQSLMRTSYAVFCLKKKNKEYIKHRTK